MDPSGAPLNPSVLYVQAHCSAQQVFNLELFATRAVSVVYFTGLGQAGCLEVSVGNASKYEFIAVASRLNRIDFGVGH
jgi:hypothetical protein